MIDDNDKSNPFSLDRNPLVSVIVTSFNKAKFLEECITSLQNQTYSNLEILVVNDGSPDDTSSVVKHLMPKFPKRLIHLVEKRNGGVSDARNFGISLSRGEFLMVLDGDDKVMPTYVEKAIASLHQHRGDIFRSNQQNFGNASDTWCPHPYDTYRLRYDNCLPTPSIYSRRLFELTGGYKTCLSYCEDWEFWVNCSRWQPKVIESSELLTCWRNTDEGLHAEGVQGRWREAVLAIAILNEDLYPIGELVGAHESLSKFHESFLTMFRKQDSIHPNNWFLKFVFGVLAESEGNDESAIDFYSRSGDLCRKEEWQPLYRLAAIFKKSGKLDEAYRSYHEVRIRRPDMAPVVNAALKEMELRSA